jgi:hypothetical protein
VRDAEREEAHDGDGDDEEGEAGIVRDVEYASVNACFII